LISRMARSSGRWWREIVVTPLFRYSPMRPWSCYTCEIVPQIWGAKSDLITVKLLPMSFSNETALHGRCSRRTTSYYA
jgi:hypothetical protein